jgi:hypothetical protein
MKNKKSKVFYPPNQIPAEAEKLITIFIAGTIDDNKSFDWQKEFVEQFDSPDIAFLNPRRKDWNSSWKQSIKDKNFKAQVNWELDHIESCDIVIMYFDPESKSPISLLELGILTKKPEKVIVCCPDGFYRKGNIEIVCERYKISLLQSLEQVVSVLKRAIDKK